MTCVTPMFYVYPIGDKKKGKIVPRSEVMQGLEMEPNHIREKLDLYNKVNSSKKCIKVPCNKCWACQLRYSAEWATRIMLECKKYSHNWFITLTYNDEHLPIAEYAITPDGEKIEKNDYFLTGTLQKHDYEKFINSLRKYFERKGHKGIKVFCAGEYGETTHRPHMHMILMNAPLDINQFYGTHVDSNFKAHWKSKEIEKIWQKGMIDIAEVEWSSAAYVARYCTKKISFESDKTLYAIQGKEPEFVRMSKGIGFDYFNDHIDEIYKNDEIIAKTVKGNVGSIKPPRAFDKKLEQINPELFKAIKESRAKCAERSRKYMESLTDQTDLNKMIQDAEKLKLKMSMLPRTAEI